MKYFVIDLESNGLSKSYHEITEISILDCQSLEQITWLIKIRHPSRSSAISLEITGKTNNELISRGRYIETVLDEINNFLRAGVEEIDDICMIAHQASFDRRFIEYAFKSNNKNFIALYWLDTVPMAKKFAKQYLGLKKTSVSLERILVTANVKNFEKNFHSSAVDVRNTFRLWKHMTSRGMSNTEFIKMSPDLMPGATGTTSSFNKKKIKLSMADFMDDLEQEEIIDEELED